MHIVCQWSVINSVQSLWLQCAPEYKVPGLYVVDSIVRQSRHQFGPEKDNFGLRFSKSFEKTFLNLFLCPPDHKVFHSVLHSLSEAAAD